MTTLPTRTKSTADSAPHDRNTMTNKQFQLQVHDNANNIAHLTINSLAVSQSHNMEEHLLPFAVNREA